MLSKSPGRALHALNEPNTDPKDSVKAEITQSVPKPIIETNTHTHTHTHTHSGHLCHERVIDSNFAGSQVWPAMYLSVYESLCVMFDNAWAQQSTSALNIFSVNF